MGLSITLDTRQAQYLTPDAELDSRLSIAVDVLKYYKDYFVPKLLTIWRGAPLRSLGGTQINQFPIINIHDTVEAAHIRDYLSRYSWQEKAELTLEFSGPCTIAKTKIDGYLNVYSRNWSPTYGDIEFNTYPTNEFPDLVHLMKVAPDLEQYLLGDFLAQLAESVKDQPLRVVSAYFGVGAPSRYEFDGLTGVYYASDDSMWADCLRTHVEEQGETAKATFTPYRQQFLISGMNAVPAFRRFVDEMFLKYGLYREKANSLVLVGRDLESFKGFYAELSSKVLKPLVQQLPNRDELLKTIREVIEGEGRKQAKLA
jgi:hypothetical protein